jgi:hypothetical protein
MIDEGRVDRDIERAVWYSRSSDRNLWRAAYHAYRVVGSYIQAATQQIADQAGRNVSTVESWAHAYEMFISMFGLNAENAKNMRRTLTVSHFSKMWAEKRKYEIPMPASESYLAQMVAYKANSQPYSVAALEREIQGHYDMLGDRPVITWVSQRDHVRNAVIRWLDYKDVPQSVHGLIERLLRELEEV